MLAHHGGIGQVTPSSQGLSLLEVSPWNGDVRFWQTSELSWAVAQVTVAVPSQGAGHCAENALSLVGMYASAS